MIVIVAPLNGVIGPGVGVGVGVGVGAWVDEADGAVPPHAIDDHRQREHQQECETPLTSGASFFSARKPHGIHSFGTSIRSRDPDVKIAGLQAQRQETLQADMMQRVL